HELARRAIQDALSPLRRRELHATALALLKAVETPRAAELAHHAEQADAAADVIDYSIRAAQEAGALGAYREATAHLSRVLQHGQALPAAARAQLFERKGFAAHFCGEFEASRQALLAAIALHRQAGDVAGLGNALRLSAHVYWNLGDSAEAERLAREAV